MFEERILEDCLVELLPFGDFPMWSFEKMLNAIPLQDADDSILRNRVIDTL